MKRFMHLLAACVRSLGQFSLCCLLCTVAVCSSVAAEPPNLILGTQAIGGRYHFTQDEPLLESARLIAGLGSGIMKFSISKQACFGKVKVNVRECDPGLKTLGRV